MGTVTGGALSFRERTARAVVLVHALETSDRRGALLPHERRRQATTVSLAAGDDGDAWIARRAADLARDAVEVLGGTWTALRRLSAPVAPLVLPILFLALVVGLATNVLGPSKRIHVLALPLLGLLAWNVTVMLLMVARHALPIGRGDPWILGALRRLARRTFARMLKPDVTEAEVAFTFFDAWVPTVAPLEAARLRRLFHLAALFVVVGAVGGMYLRGIAFAYQATWESTFLSDATVDSLLGTILGPAAAVLGVELPPAGPIRAPLSGPAGTWIHLWAVTAALFVGLPRGLLVMVESAAVARLARRLPIHLPELYLRRLRAAASGEDQRVDVVPYSYRLPAASADRLRAELFDVFGARAEIRVHAAAEYGDEAADLDVAGGRARVVLFSLSQTPEIEVHGALMKALRDELPDGQALVAVVDAAPLAQKLGGNEKRLGERRRAWDRVLDDAGVPACHLDLKSDSDEALVRALVRGAWPPGILEDNG